MLKIGFIEIRREKKHIRSPNKKKKIGNSPSIHLSSSGNMKASIYASVEIIGIIEN